MDGYSSLSKNESLSLLLVLMYTVAPPPKRSTRQRRLPSKLRGSATNETIMSWITISRVSILYILVDSFFFELYLNIISQFFNSKATVMCVHVHLALYCVHDLSMHDYF